VAAVARRDRERASSGDGARSLLRRAREEGAGSGEACVLPGSAPVCGEGAATEAREVAVELGGSAGEGAGPRGAGR
jgi:hypothetical protein